MRTAIRVFLSCVLIAGLLTVSAFAQPISSGETAAQKVIAVVFDDSTSMVRDDYTSKEQPDPGKLRENYTTRWVEADYAVRAIAAMMDKGDVLLVYPLNGGDPIQVTIGSDQMEYTLNSGLNAMGYYGATAFDVVKVAADHLKEEDGKDCRLIIITDGNFKKDGRGPDLTQEELDEEFKGIVSPKIQISYIQIGKSQNNIYPSNKDITVHGNTSAGITRQITNVINQIYSRVAMEDADKPQLDQTDSISLHFNVPVKNVTVFLQATTDQEDALKSIQSRSNVYRLPGIKPIHSTDKEPDILWYSDSETVVKEYIQTVSLSGAVLNYTAPSTGSMEPITIQNVPGIDEDNIQIYYEPAVIQRVTIQQEGGEPFVYQPGESFFVEGKISLTIDYLDLNRTPLKDQSASMLKTDGTVVCVNGFPLERTRNADGVYTYSGVLSTSDSGGEITITNEIGLDGGQLTIPLGTIYEPNVQLAVSLSEETICLDETGSADLAIEVRNLKSGELLSESEWRDNLTLSCTSEYFIANEGGCTYDGGIISIPVSLKDVNQHQLSEDGKEMFTISVIRTYSDGVRPPAAVTEEPFVVNITSMPHTLSVCSEEAPIKALGVFLFGGEIPITYFCDGDALTEEQLQAANISFLIGNSPLDGLITLENGNLHLTQRSLQWLQLREENCLVEFDFAYTKWNRQERTLIPVTLNLRPVAPWEILSILLIIVSLPLLLLAFLLSGKKSDYIKRGTIFRLNLADDLGNESPAYLEWKPLDWFLFRAHFWGERYAHVQNHQTNTSGRRRLPLYIDLYISRNGGWKLGKLHKMKPAPGENCVYIGDKPVANDRVQFDVGSNHNKRLRIQSEQTKKGWLLTIEEPK